MTVGVELCRHSILRRLAVVGLGCAIVCGTGCRLFHKNAGGDGERRDPLLGRYIPKTDLPVPDRGTVGRGDRKDPLLISPTGTSKSPGDVPFRPGPETTAAGLAGRLRTEDTGLSMGDRREPAAPAGRSAGVKLERDPAVAIPTESWDRYADELKRLKATFDPPERESGGEYVMSAAVAAKTDGATKRYEGVGPTAAAAAKQLVDQIRGDQ